MSEFVCDFGPFSFAFLTEPQSFAAALRLIAVIGGEDSPMGPRLALEVRG